MLASRAMNPLSIARSPVACAMLGAAALVALGCASGRAAPPVTPVDVSVPSASAATVTPAPSPAAAERATSCPAPERVIGLDRDETCRNVPTCERACRSGSAASCVTAGNLDATAAHPDAERELRDYGRACSLGNALGCTNYGATLRLAHRDPADLACAARLFTLACDHAEAYGCAMLGAAYATGEGTRRSEHRALEVLLKGCNPRLAHRDGVAMACENLIALLRSAPDGSPPAITQRALHYAEQIGCNAGSAKACAALGRAAPP